MVKRNVLPTLIQTKEFGNYGLFHNLKQTACCPSQVWPAKGVALSEPTIRAPGYEVNTAVAQVLPTPRPTILSAGIWQRVFSSLARWTHLRCPRQWRVRRCPSGSPDLRCLMSVVMCVHVCVYVCVHGHDIHTIMSLQYNALWSTTSTSLIPRPH